MLWGLSPRDLLELLLMPVALALLAPWITRRWQERQRDFNTKVELVAEISRLVMTTVMTFHLNRTNQTAHAKDGEKLSAELDVAYKKWVIGSCVIGSKLHAYFPDPGKHDLQLHIKWRQFSDAVSHYSREPEGHTRIEDWEIQKSRLFDAKALIIAEILVSEVTGFGYRSAANPKGIN